MSPSVSPDINPANKTTRTIINMWIKNSISQHRYSTTIPFFSFFDFSTPHTLKILTLSSQQIMKILILLLLLDIYFQFYKPYKPKPWVFGERERARRERAFLAITWSCISGLHLCYNNPGYDHLLQSKNSCKTRFGFSTNPFSFQIRNAIVIFSD